MKASARFAAVSLLLAFAATCEASSMHDAAIRRCQSRPHYNINAASGHVDNGSAIIKPANRGHCSHVGATSQVTKLSGPNGNIEWLNCNIDSSGWSPAPVKLEELIVVSLETARHTAFASCSDEIIGIFIKYEKLYNVPAIIFASIAMQESGCDPHVVGGAGEQGLMQITPDKCKGAPNGNCQDIDFNIKTGAKYFISVLEENGYDILITIGKYNGWNPGMTYADATRAAQTCCRCQNNLDYIHQFVNGWCQGVNAYQRGLGKYHNLENCH